MEGHHRLDHDEAPRPRADRPAQAVREDAEAEEAARADPLHDGAGEEDEGDLHQQHADPDVAHRARAPALRAHEDGEELDGALVEEVRAEGEDEQAPVGRVPEQGAELARPRAEREPALAREEERDPGLRPGVGEAIGYGEDEAEEER